MNGKIGEGGVLSKVTPRTLRAYVEAHGWHKVEPYGDIGDVYAFGNESPEIVVPLSSHFGDYTLRLEQMVTILADTEEREREAVLRDLSMADVDLVRVRMSESGGDGSISIDTAAEVVKQSRNMLLAAACSAVSPQRAFRTNKSKKAKQYVSSVRFGQTERGSFVINILSPAPRPLGQQMTDIPTAEPFSRKAVHKLVSGLQATRKAVDLAGYWDTDFGEFENRVDVGVSANLCDAVGGILGQGNEGRVDVSINWALTYPRPGDRVRVRFAESDTPILEEASRVLKERQERPDELIEGYVISLTRQESDYQGHVTVRGVIDGFRRSVRVELDHEDYDKVIDAHDRRRKVSIMGELIRKGRQWTLENPRNLAVHEDR